MSKHEIIAAVLLSLTWGCVAPVAEEPIDLISLGRADVLHFDLEVEPRDSVRFRVNDYRGALTFDAEGSGSFVVVVPFLDDIRSELPAQISDAYVPGGTFQLISQSDEPMTVQIGYRTMDCMENDPSVEVVGRADPMGGLGPNGEWTEQEICDVIGEQIRASFGDDYFERTRS